MNYHKKQVMSRYDEDCARPAHVLWKGKNYVCWPQALQARHAEETAWNKTRPGKNSQATKSQHSRVRNSKQTKISHTFFANKFQVNAKDRQIKQKKPKELTLGSHFLVGTYLSAILFSVQQADKFLPPEQRTSQN